MTEQPTLIHGIRPGLDTRGLERGQIPVADWLCACGRHERARGDKDVQALCARARVDHCPHTIHTEEAA